MAYRPASFRGVRFHVLDASGEKGKRLEVNEFHGRDVPYTESHGRKARRWSFRAFLLGPDAGARAVALAIACEANGAGQLTLPSEGQVLVECETVRHSESVDGGRMAVLDLQFVEKGTTPGLIVNVLAGAAGFAAATAAVPVISGIYTATLGALDQLGQSIVNDTVLAVTGNLGQLHFVASDSAAHARCALGILDLQQSISPATDAAGALPIIIAALRAAGAGAEVFAAPASALPATIEPDAICVQDLVRRLFLIEEARALMDQDLTSRDQADALRTAITGRFDAEIDTAAVARQSDLLATLRKLHANVVRDLLERGRPLPRLASVTLSRSLPALVIAHRLWRDASRAGEVVAETGALHPGFMPREIRALTA
ncbi:DNA circularization N-terminal domain-containing protein [Xanthobacter sp. VTT E-85241]|uniref:DNA circularization N-terminal domain-containing protein n=1 Tax=Roseixanthobacter finlandensis TaxID=3119922 RepID=UPI0037287645